MKNIANNCVSLLASWSSGNAFVSGAGSLRFKSWAGQVGHSVANGCNISWNGAVLPTDALTRRWLRQLVTRFGVIQRIISAATAVNPSSKNTNN